MNNRVDPASDPICELLPRPEESEPSRSSLNGSLLVLAVMFGWLLIVFGVSAAVARNDPNVEVPISISRGVVVTPADGWYSAEDVWDVGDSAIALQKSGVYVAFWVEAYVGTSEELMAEVIDQLKPSFSSFRALPARAVTVAGERQLPAVMVQFSAVTEWGNEENELVALSHGGTGVVMLAEAPPGQLRWAQGDIDTMWRTIEIP